MATGRIQFTVGSISFAGEGETDWVVEQLDGFLKRMPELVGLARDTRDTEHAVGESTGSLDPDSNVSLASFLKSTQASANQTRKFLATAEWLRLRGSPRTTTAAVVKALRENSQKGLGNASDCLNKNVAKGFCEKVGNEFFVTDDGRASLQA